jgi:hypothetical protein
LIWKKNWTCSHHLNMFWIWKRIWVLLSLKKTLHLLSTLDRALNAKEILKFAWFWREHKKLKLFGYKL